MEVRDAECSTGCPILACGPGSLPCSDYNFAVPLARRLSGFLAAAALVPPLFWLGPALVRRLAPSYRDQGDFFYPLKLYTADRLRAGEVPLWNSLSGAGEPWLGNGQAGVFYPPSLLLMLMIATVFVALLSFSVVLSRQRQQIDRLMEETAILGAEIRDLRTRNGAMPDGLPSP